MEEREIPKFDFGFVGRTARMLDLFDFGIVNQAGKRRIVLNPSKGTTPERVSLSGDDFMSATAKIMEKWSEQAITLDGSWEDRKAMIDDLRQMFYNSPQTAKGVIMSRDEALQADANITIIGVESASKKQRDHILGFIKRTKLERYLKDTIFSILLYGDAGWTLSFGKTGVTSVHPVGILDIEKVLEFNASEIKEAKDLAFNYLKRNAKIQELITSIEKQHDYGDFFKPYALGYLVKGILIPPWQFIHFRNFSTDSPFKPFGMPPFIHALAPYRQREMAMSLQMAARVARFPIGRYKLKFPNTYAPTDKLDEATRFVNKLDNSGLYAIRKESSGIGGRIITIDELFEYDEMVSNIDLGRIDDIELLKDDERDSSFLPKSAFYPEGGGIGSSGVSLVQQFKPFGRFIYNIQSVVLEGLTQLCAIDMILSNKFSEDELDFILTMPYPESQTDRELIGSQKDLVDLVGGVLDMIAKRLFNDEAAPLPRDLVKAVMTQLLPYDDQRVDDWVDMAIASRAEGAEAKGDQKESFKERYDKLPGKALKEAIEQSFDKYIKQNFTEGTIRGRHYQVSNFNGTFDPKFLLEAKKDRAEKLAEQIRWEIEPTKEET